MQEVTSDQDLDQLVWSLIQHSRNPDDYLDYLRHTYNRPAVQEAAYQAAVQHWPGSEERRCFEQAVAALEQLARAGSEVAMFHLGRWYRLGYGVAVDSEVGLAWYRKGAEAGSARCLINLARHTALSDPQTAISMYCRAAEELGDLSAHCFWADCDKANYLQHLELAATSGDPFSLYCLAYERLRVLADGQDARPWIEMLKTAAGKGESSGALYLAQVFRKGSHGCDMDAETSAYWFRHAVSLGNEAACAIYGRICLDAHDEARGLDYLKRGAMLGDAYGQSVLGYHLAWHGQSQAEHLEGVHWLRAAARQNHRPALAKLAEALQHQRGPECEPEEALLWLRKGVSQGIAECQTALGTAYIQGEGVARDEEKAHNLFHIASLQGDAWGTYLLGLTHENGHGTPKDAVQAFQCYRTAADKGLLKAAFKLAMAYLWGEGVEEDIPAGAKWLKKAATAGHAEAQAYLGMLFAYGHGVEENPEIAVQWLRQSAQQDHPIGLRELAKFYEAGEGVEKDLTEATRLMAKAASLGDQKAADWISKNCPEKPLWLKQLGASNGFELPEGEQPEEGQP